MNICLNCKEETANLKFCNRSCAATFNNKIVGNRHGTVPIENLCLNCEAPVGKATYCSSKCFGQKKRKDSINAWLSGEINHAPGGVKSFLLEEQDHRCLICNMKDEWQGNPIVFILDHIDGNSENNLRINLRLVCPNCDSQLPTYKAKNTGNGRFKRRQRYADGKSY